MWLKLRLDHGEVEDLANSSKSKLFRICSDGSSRKKDVSLKAMDKTPSFSVQRWTCTSDYNHTWAHVNGGPTALLWAAIFPRDLLILALRKKHILDSTY